MSRSIGQMLWLDANNHPLDFDGFGLEAIKKEMTFDGATENDPGDIDGTGNPATLFTVTGDVIVRVMAYCTVLLAGASATLEVGTTKSIANIIAQTTATAIDADEIWHDATPDNNVEAVTVAPERFLVNGADIIQTAATANITAGSLVYYCWWRPISADGSVVAA